jgi:hypothetical protein
VIVQILVVQCAYLRATARFSRIASRRFAISAAITDATNGVMKTQSRVGAFFTTLLEKSAKTR